MNHKRLLLIAPLLLVIVGFVWCQTVGDTIIDPKNISTLNRIAEEYDFWKWVFGIAAVLLAVWSFFGLKFFVKTKADEWVMGKIAKEADIKVEHVKAAISEFSRVAELKKKKITVVSAAEGQQANVKKVFDGCRFTNFEWKSITQIPSVILEDSAVILFNDQLDLPLTEPQIESVMGKFKTNVGYFYFGDKRLKSDLYRNTYKIDLDFCNSSTRLEAGLISLLKII